MAATQLFRESDYHKESKVRVEGPEWHQKLFTSYTAYGDAYFARGYIGLVYALWVIAVGVVALLQVVNVFSERFVVTLALLCSELILTFVATAVLAFFAKWSTDSLDRIRRYGIGNVSIDTIRNMTRTRLNANNDLALLAQGLLWSIILVTVASVLATGVENDQVGTIDYLNAPAALDTHNHPLSTLAPPGLATAALMLVLNVLIVVKTCQLIGGALSRVDAVRMQEKLLKLDVAADAAKNGVKEALTGPKDRVKYADGSIVQLKTMIDIA